MKTYLIFACLISSTLSIALETKVVEITSDNNDFQVQMQTSSGIESRWEEVEVPHMCERTDTYNTPSTCYRDEEYTTHRTCYRPETRKECYEVASKKCVISCSLFRWRCSRVCSEAKEQCEEVTRNVAYACEQTRIRNVAYDCERSETRVVQYECTRVERREISAGDVVNYYHYIYFQVNTNNRKDVYEKVELQVMGPNLKVKQIDKVQLDLKILPISSRQENYNGRIVVHHDVIISI